MRNDSERLADILEALEKIARYAPRGRSFFESDEMLQVWVIHHLQIIGEAASRISPTTRNQLPDIPWGKIIGMRHVLVHSYFEIDPDIVWSVIESDLFSLKQQIKNALDELSRT